MMNASRALGLMVDEGGRRSVPLFGRKSLPQRPYPQRVAEVQRWGKEALLLEARLDRPITKNDLFLELHIPFDLLDPVVEAIATPVTVDLRTLGSAERERFERASHDVIVRGFAERPRELEMRGLTLATVAAVSLPSATLQDCQVLFAYMRAVLELKELPPAQILPSAASAALAQARALPPEERNLFRLVRNLGIGLYTARLVKEALG